MEKRLPASSAAVFYLLLAGAAWAFGDLWAGLDLLTWHDRNETSVAFDGVLGAGVGVIVVFLSAMLDRFAAWARKLSEAFAELLGELTLSDVFVLAVTSSVAEEIFFRGFLQQLFSAQVFETFANGDIVALLAASVVFGAVHVGPDPKTFFPWTIMAVVMGFVLGGMYLYTGNVLAPILAHFTINFLNLSLIAQQAGKAEA